MAQIEHTDFWNISSSLPIHCILAWNLLWHYWNLTYHYPYQLYPFLNTCAQFWSQGNFPIVSNINCYEQMILVSFTVLSGQFNIRVCMECHSTLEGRNKVKFSYYLLHEKYGPITWLNDVTTRKHSDTSEAVMEF